MRPGGLRHKVGGARDGGARDGARDCLKRRRRKSRFWDTPLRPGSDFMLRRCRLERLPAIVSPRWPRKCSPGPLRRRFFTNRPVSQPVPHSSLRPPASSAAKTGRHRAEIPSWDTRHRPHPGGRKGREPLGKELTCPTGLSSPGHNHFVVEYKALPAATVKPLLYPGGGGDDLSGAL
jgi:hypothetical protein